MNNDAGPVFSLVIALVAGAIGGRKGMGPAYGAIAGGLFMAFWGVLGFSPLGSGLAFGAVAMMFVSGGLQGLFWGALWGAVGGWFTRPRAQST